LSFSITQKLNRVQINAFTTIIMEALEMD